MKNILAPALFFLILNAGAQNTAPDFDAPSWKPPYSLSLEGWGIERFLIPIEFAPSIPYKGVEDVRFTKGWGDVKTDEYWSYAYLWYLEGKPVITKDSVERNLSAYYDGLIGRNIEQRKISAEKVFKTKVTVSKITTAAGDENTFKGTIYMLDYMQQKPITFNCIVHHKICPGKNNSFIFNGVSPRPLTDAVWDKLNGLWSSFNCTPQ